MSSIKNIIRRKLVKLISSVYDPLIDFKIGNQTIKIPLSHPLREILKIFPQLNYNLPRLVKFVSDREKDVKVIDIGANIGDTVAFIKNYADVPILCIDGDDKYISILKQNITQYKNISICHSLVGAETRKINLELKKERGTAYLVESKEKHNISTLEDILEKNPAFKNSRLLKIDTDGFDTIILKGSPNYLTRNRPILFFEFDPFLAKKNNDDPFRLIAYLKQCGYKYLIFYMNNGDYLLSCTVNDERMTNELIHYFSGRNIELYADICAFPESDKELFENFTAQEIDFFKKLRSY